MRKLKKNSSQIVVVSLLAVIIFVLIMYGFGVLAQWREQVRYQVLEYKLAPLSCNMKELNCKIIAEVSNPTNEPLTPQYLDTSGGPLSGVTYNIVVFEKNNELCHASAHSGVGASNITIPPKSKRTLSISCINMVSKNTRSTPVRVEIYGKPYELTLAKLVGRRLN